jgi:hypothetical protein
VEGVNKAVGVEGVFDISVGGPLGIKLYIYANISEKKDCIDHQHGCLAR